MPHPSQQQSEQLAALWTQAQPVVSAYIATLVPDYHQAEEVLQRVAVALVRKFGSYDLSRPFVPWAIGIARLEVLRSRRDFATDRHQFGTEMVDRLAELYESDHEVFARWREGLRHCLGQMGGRNREALSLRYHEDLDPTQIADRMGMKPVAVRVLLHRVRQALKRCIETYAGQKQTGGRE